MFAGHIGAPSVMAMAASSLATIAVFWALAGWLWKRTA
jgi:hypothetical protein